MPRRNIAECKPHWKDNLDKTELNSKISKATKRSEFFQPTRTGWKWDTQWHWRHRIKLNQPCLPHTDSPSTILGHVLCTPPSVCNHLQWRQRKHNYTSQHIQARLVWIALKLICIHKPIVHNTSFQKPLYMYFLSTVLLGRNLTGNVFANGYRVDTEWVQECKQNRYRTDTKWKWNKNDTDTEQLQITKMEKKHSPEYKL